MQRALLIRPKRYPSDGRMVMPIGLLSIAAHARQHGIHVDILDCEADDWRRFDFHGYDVYGLSVCMRQQEAGARSIHTRISDKASDTAQIVVGGTHATFSDMGMSVIKGEGEQPFLRLCGVDNTFDIETSSLPAYDLLDIERYFAFGKGENPFTTSERVIQYETSRGCPFACKFCVSKKFWGNWRGKSPDKILSELASLKADYNIDEVNIIDPNLLASPKRALQIFKAWSSVLPDVSWSNPGGIWVGGLSEDLLFYMRRSGCTQLTFPIETTNPELAEKYGLDRKVNLKHAERMACCCRKLGIAIHGFFIAGMKGQTIKDTKRDLSYARKLGFESVSLNLLVAFPGSEIESDNLDYKRSTNRKLQTTIQDMQRTYNSKLKWRHPIRYLRKYGLLGAK